MTNKSPEAHYIHGAAPEEQDRLSKLNVILNQRSLHAMQLKGGERILDVGSGLGQFSRMMAIQAGPDGKVIGIERDEQQLNKAIHLAQLDQEHHLVEFRPGNAYLLPLTTDEWGTFDIVHTRFVLEHLSQPLKAIEQMILAAKPGGRIILEDDDHSTFRPTPEPMGFSVIWRAYLRSYERLGNDPYIGRRFVSLFQEAGIQQINIDELFFGACSGNDTFPLVAENLIGILSGAKALILKEGLMSQPSFEKAIQGLQEWKKLPDAALWYSIPWAEGVKA